MDLVGNRVRLRPLMKHDLAKMALWNNDAEVQQYVDCNLSSNLTELERWYKTNVPDRNYQIFAIENLQGEVIGDLEFDHICWHPREAELRVRIGEKTYWGQGYGNEAVRLALDYFMNEKQFKRIYLKVYQFNIRAIRCYQKNGFKPVGILQRKDQKWKNIILMELTRDNFISSRRTGWAG
ncbi:MAG TPA: GNAT family N-acetyltransferase [Bacillota bacterium]